jgi:high-affinity Fe2+/Pb2+ permease
VTTTQIVQAVPVSKTTTSRPIALAIIAIVAFAAAAAWFAYQYFTDSALRNSFRR